MSCTSSGRANERPEDWTLESVINEFARDPYAASENFSLAKKDWLHRQYEEIELSAAEPTTASDVWCDQVGIPRGCYVVHVIADLLDAVEPREAGETRRLIEICQELQHWGHLTAEDVEEFKRL